MWISPVLCLAIISWLRARSTVSGSQATQHTHTCTHIYTMYATHTHTHTCEHTHVHISHPHTHTHAHTHANTCTQTHARTHTHAHTHARTRTHTHTHSHPTQVLWNPNEHSYEWLVCGTNSGLVHLFRVPRRAAKPLLHTKVLK